MGREPLQDLFVYGVASRVRKRLEVFEGDEFAWRLQLQLQLEGAGVGTGGVGQG